MACLQREVSARESHGGEGRIRAARFPSRKSLEEFDFDHARGLKRDLIAHLRTLDFVVAKDNVVFLGPPGTGKTHLAIDTSRTSSLLGLWARHETVIVAIDVHAPRWSKRARLLGLYPARQSCRRQEWVLRVTEAGASGCRGDLQPPPHSQIKVLFAHERCVRSRRGQLVRHQPELHPAADLSRGYLPPS